MNKKTPFITIKPDNIKKVVSGLVNKIPQIHNVMEKKMNLIVEVVWRSAKQKRPKISVTKNNRGQYRVSDPDAILGVPVDTGILQASITKEVKWQGDKIIGEIDAGVGIPYAQAIEYGRSDVNMRPRPFMRPAYNENLEWIKNKWKEKST